MFITLDCAIQRPRVPGRARSAAARKNVNNKRETRKHFIQLWSLMPRSCSISLNGGIPMLRICFALIVYIHGCHFVTAPQGGILLPCMPTHFASATLRCLSHSRAASAGSNRHGHRRPIDVAGPTGPAGHRGPAGSAGPAGVPWSWPGDVIARNGVLVRYDGFGPSQAKTK